MQRLGVDAQLRRQQLERNASRQIAEGTKADRLFKEMNRRTTPSAAEIENTLYNASAGGMQEGFDQAPSVAARQQGRTNTSNSNLMTEIGRARAKELGGLKANAKLQAMSMAPQLANEEQKCELIFTICSLLVPQPNQRYRSHLLLLTVELRNKECAQEGLRTNLGLKLQ